MKQAHKTAEMIWDRERLQLQAEASNGGRQACFCDNFHISKTEHDIVVDGLEEELAAADRKFCL
jgi:hypothetical protein